MNQQERDIVPTLEQMSPAERATRVATLVGDRRRLDVVHASNLLDTPFEEAFDSLSRLAARLLGASASFLSIVAEDHDFYKSQHGFPENLATSRHLKGPTFCQLAITSDKPLVISDTHGDPAWRAIPTVDSLGVRAYVGVPLFIDSQPIGSFCVIDNVPRIWSDVEIETLVQFTNSALREIKLRKALQVATLEMNRANELAQAREQLLAVVAHDMRSPLQVLTLSALILKNFTSDAGLPHLERLNGNISSLTRLAEDLVTTYGAGTQGQSACVAAGKLLADAVDTMGLLAENAGLQLAIDAEPAGDIVIDSAQILRVLCNLIGNAIKYCPPGTIISLHSVRDGDRVLVSVIDNGPGMSATEQSHAFDRGWQGGAGVKRKDGVGLGLYIVRYLVEQNGGTVSLLSVIGKGTTVTIILPNSGE